MDNNMEWGKMKNSKGFTLIEVLIVIGVIGILSAIAIPTISSWLPNYRLKAAARDVYSTMQKARMLAVKMNNNTAVVFDPGNNKYELCDDWVAGVCAGSVQITDFSSIGSGVGYGHGEAPDQANASATAFPLSPDDNVSYASPDNVAVFNSRGFGSAGYVYLDHQKNTTTYAVSSLSSGVVRILKWQGGGWK